MTKFSELAAASAASKSAVDAANAQLSAAQSADGSARGAVTAALKTQTPPTAALVDPSGAVSVYALTATGDDFTVSTVPGDFDVPTPDPVPASDPTAPPPT